MKRPHVTTTVSNPADLEKYLEAEFLVDTGAIDCLVPGNQLREIGLAPQGGGELMSLPMAATILLS